MVQVQVNRDKIRSLDDIKITLDISSALDIDCRKHLTSSDQNPTPCLFYLLKETSLFHQCRAYLEQLHLLFNMN